MGLDEKLMDGSNFEILLLNNLRVLGANFDRLKLPTDPNQIGATLRSFPKLSLGKLIGFLLSKLDNMRFERTIKPLLICYNRTVDNQLKNLFFMWIKELPVELGLSTGFSRVWSCPCPKKSPRFFAVFTMYVLEKCMGLDLHVNLDASNAFDDNVDEFLRNISLLQSKSPLIDKLIASEKSLSVIKDSNILFDCLNYARLPKSVGDVLHKLSFYQRSRWAELQSLKNLFSLHHAEWLNMRPLYLDMSVLSTDSPIVRAKDLNDSVDMVSDTELPSLSRLMERNGNLFRMMGNSLTRFGDVGRSLGTEPSSELSWCSRSLSRIAESSKFFEQQNLVTDAQGLLSQLDDILTTLSDLIAAESDLLSVSINRSSGRLSGLHIDISMDSKNGPSSQGAPLNNSSLLSKSQASSYSAPTKAQLIGGKDDEIGEVMEKSTGLSPNATADVAEFGTNDDMFNHINAQLASLLQTTTSEVHRNSIENEITGNVQSNSQVVTPYIQPPLVPLRLSSRRASLKSPRLGTLMSPEQTINRKGTILPNTYPSPHFKSFSEFSAEGNGSNTRSPRPPLASIDMNVEGRTRPTLPSSLDRLCINSPSDEREYRQGDGTKREDDSGPDDESLGLLSFGDMSDCTSQIFFSP